MYEIKFRVYRLVVWHMTFNHDNVRSIRTRPIIGASAEVAGIRKLLSPDVDAESEGVLTICLNISS